MAKAIYLAVGRARHIRWFNDYPVVVVEDKGDHWTVSQKSGKPPPERAPSNVIISAGGASYIWT